MSKILMAIMIAGLAILTIIIVTLLGSVFLASGLDIQGMLSRILVPIRSGLQVFMLMSIGILIALIFKRTGLSILIFLLYTFFFEAIIRGILFRMNLDALNGYFPLKVHNSLFPYSQSDGMEYLFKSAGGQSASLVEALAPGVDLTGMALAGIYTLGFFFISIWLISRKDLR